MRSPTEEPPSEASGRARPGPGPCSSKSSELRLTGQGSHGPSTGSRIAHPKRTSCPGQSSLSAQHSSCAQSKTRAAGLA